MTQQEQDEKDKKEFKDYLVKGDMGYILEATRTPYNMAEFIWLVSRRLMRNKEEKDG